MLVLINVVSCTDSETAVLTVEKSGKPYIVKVQGFSALEELQEVLPKVEEVTEEARKDRAEKGSSPDLEVKFEDEGSGSAEGTVAVDNLDSLMAFNGKAGFTFPE